MNFTKLFNNLDTSNLIPNSSNVQIITKKKEESNKSIPSTSKTNIDNFYKEFNDFKYKTDEELKLLNIKIKLKPKTMSNDVISRVADQSEVNNNSLQNNENINNIIFNEIKPIAMNNLKNTSNIDQQLILATINQLQENDKIVIQSLTHKVSKEELDRMQRQFAVDLEKIV